MQGFWYFCRLRLVGLLFETGTSDHLFFSKVNENGDIMAHCFTLAPGGDHNMSAFVLCLLSFIPPKNQRSHYQDQCHVQTTSLKGQFTQNSDLLTAIIWARWLGNTPDKKDNMIIFHTWKLSWSCTRFHPKSPPQPSRSGDGIRVSSQD